MKPTLYRDHWGEQLTGCPTCNRWQASTGEWCRLAWRHRCVTRTQGHQYRSRLSNRVVHSLLIEPLKPGRFCRGLSAPITVNASTWSVRWENAIFEGCLFQKMFPALLTLPRSANRDWLLWSAADRLHRVQLLGLARRRATSHGNAGRYKALRERVKKRTRVPGP